MSGVAALRVLVADLIAEIEAEAAVRRQRTGSQALGVRRGEECPRCFVPALS